MRTEQAPDAPQMYSYMGNRDPYGVQWQRYLADVACGRHSFEDILAA